MSKAFEELIWTPVEAYRPDAQEGKVIPVLFVTWDRLEYTKKAFEGLLRAGMPFELNIWDNGSNPDTAVWLYNAMTKLAFGSVSHRDPIPGSLIYWNTNQGLARAMNWFFKKYEDAKYVVKLDNDTVLPENWLRDLVDVMDSSRWDGRLGAVSGTCWRPNGWTFDEWVEKAMTTVPFRKHKLHFNSYILGTGVLINMDMIRQRGALIEWMPCPISGWTDYTRMAHEDGDWSFAFYSKFRADLLNLKAEHELSNDYPEYDELLDKMRSAGNEWWTHIGGTKGIRDMLGASGGYTKLGDYVPITERSEGVIPPPEPKLNFITHPLLKYSPVRVKLSAEDLKSSGPKAHFTEVGLWSELPALPDYVVQALKAKERMDRKDSAITSFTTGEGVNKLNLFNKLNLSAGDLMEKALDLAQRRSPGPLIDVRALAERRSRNPTISPIRKLRMSHCQDYEERATLKWWEDRVRSVGVHKSTFGDQPQSQVSAFTIRHQDVLKEEIRELRSTFGECHVLDVGCGWGRMTKFLTQRADSYVGVDFVEDLILQARESFPNVQFDVAPAWALPYDSDWFDMVVCIACATSFDAVWDKVIEELKRVVRPGGFVLMLEEFWMRKDWK